MLLALHRKRTIAKLIWDRWAVAVVGEGTSRYSVPADEWRAHQARPRYTAERLAGLSSRGAHAGSLYICGGREVK